MSSKWQIALKHTLSQYIYINIKTTVGSVWWFSEIHLVGRNKEPLSILEATVVKEGKVRLALVRRLTLFCNWGRRGAQVRDQSAGSMPVTSALLNLLSLTWAVTSAASPQMDWLILCVVIVTSLIQILSVGLAGAPACCSPLVPWLTPVLVIKPTQSFFSLILAPEV